MTVYKNLVNKLRVLDEISLLFLAIELYRRLISILRIHLNIEALSLVDV